MMSNDGFNYEDEVWCLVREMFCAAAVPLPPVDGVGVIDAIFKAAIQAKSEEESSMLMACYYAWINARSATRNVHNSPARRAYWLDLVRAQYALVIK